MWINPPNRISSSNSIAVPPPPLSLYSLQAYAQIYCQMLVEIFKTTSQLVAISPVHHCTNIYTMGTEFHFKSFDPRGGILKFNYNLREKERRKQ